MDGTHPCPFCAEPIKLEAIKCKHCGEMMPGQVRPQAPDGSPGSRDEEQLRNLALGHTIGSILIALFGCMFLLHLGVGIATLVVPETMHGKSGGAPPAFFGWVFTIAGGAAVLGFWTIAALIFAAGRFIRARKRHTFCLIVAGLACLIMPFGTALGVCSFIVLGRPSVRALFPPLRVL